MTVCGMDSDTQTLAFTVPGDPKPLKRHRMTRGGHTYDPAENRDAKASIRYAAYEAMRMARHTVIDAPIALTCVFYLSRPKSVSVAKRRLPTTKPDLDNLEKMVKDALTGVIWRDDSLVCVMHSRKEYGEPRTEVEVSVIGSEIVK